MTTNASDDRTLVLDRILEAPREAVWRCWTEGELLRQWFCPKPWGVSRAELDVRPGGRNFVVMQGPQGEQVPVAGHTRYVARALHWSAADRETHEKLGFHQGWAIAADQLEALARSI